MNLRLRLHPKQGKAFLSEATEILYGGAAGAGKSHLKRVAAILWCASIPGLQVYLFRRTYPDLWRNHMEGPGGLPAMLADWIGSGHVRINTNDAQVIFWNGSKINLCHCQHAKDVIKYQGAEIHALLIDELTHFPDDVYRFLRGRCRLGSLNIPPQWEGKFPCVLSGANPGGEGHHWVKAAFIDGAKPMELRQMPAKEGGMLRQYIPARLADNPTIDGEDYSSKLAGLGSEALVRAMLDGDWDIVAGAYFTEFTRDRHVMRPVTLPAHWTRYRAFDWGSARPFACLWLAVADGDSLGMPRGALVVYRELYGMAEKYDQGVKLPADKVARQILDIDRGETTKSTGFGVADPAMFATDGGPSIAEAMRDAGLMWWRADNKRGPGWEQVRIRLRGDGDGKPLLYIFETCLHLIRTLPAAQHDEHKPEDVETDSEDHLIDALRYGLMARPIATAASKAPKPAVQTGSIEWLMARTNDEPERSKYRRGL